MLWLTRRPTPMEVKNIGVWEKIFDAILHTAALTNVGMIVFTTDIMDGHNGESSSDLKNNDNNNNNNKWCSHDCLHDRHHGRPQRRVIILESP